MPAPHDIHRASTTVMSALMVVLGVAMIAATLARGGGPLAIGLLLGVLFVLAGAGRLWVQRRSG